MKFSSNLVRPARRKTLESDTAHDNYGSVCKLLPVEHRVEPGDSVLLHGGEDVGVGVGGEHDAGVTETLGDDLRVAHPPFRTDPPPPPRTPPIPPAG